MAVAMWFALVAGCQFYASGFAPTFKVFVRERQP